MNPVRRPLATTLSFDDSGLSLAIDFLGRASMG